jgi:ATP-dependent Clp protease adaptor protein ClpS
MSNAEAVTDTKTRINEEVKEPPMFKVIYLNDNQTSMEFVVQSLVEFFDYNEDTATDITLDIHNIGSATVAVLPYELAEQKGVEVTLSARANNFPLQVRLEADA